MSAAAAHTHTTRTHSCSLLASSAARRRLSMCVQCSASLAHSHTQHHNSSWLSSHDSSSNFITTDTRCGTRFVAPRRERGEDGGGGRGRSRGQRRSSGAGRRRDRGVGAEVNCWQGEEEARCKEGSQGEAHSKRKEEMRQRLNTEEGSRIAPTVQLVTPEFSVADAL
jgi:hypothetical protein